MASLIGAGAIFDSFYDREIQKDTIIMLSVPRWMLAQKFKKTLYLCHRGGVICWKIRRVARAGCFPGARQPAWQSEGHIIWLAGCPWALWEFQKGPFTMPRGHSYLCNISRSEAIYQCRGRPFMSAATVIEWLITKTELGILPMTHCPPPHPIPITYEPSW